MAQTTRAVGTKYEATRDLDIAAVAKLVRSDIKAAVATGALPPGKYSVRIERYSMGQSITIRLASLETFESLACDLFDRDRMIAAERGTAGGRVQLSSAAKGVLAQVEAIVEAYNRRETDWNSDYSNVRFHLNVDFDLAWESEREEIERNIARGFVVSEEMFPSAGAQESWLAFAGVAS